MFVHPRKPFAHTLNEGSLTMSPEHCDMSNDFLPSGRAGLVAGSRLRLLLPSLWSGSRFAGPHQPRSLSRQLYSSHSCQQTKLKIIQRIDFKVCHECTNFPERPANYHSEASMYAYASYNDLWIVDQCSVFDIQHPPISLFKGCHFSSIVLINRQGSVLNNVRT
jgi:hypothetical protein